MHFVYILQSESTGRFYVGSCQELATRLAQHNSGKVTSTKAYRPWQVAYHEQQPDGLAARRREMQLKALKSRVALQRLIDATSSAG